MSEHQLHRRNKLPNKVSEYQGKYGRKLAQNEEMIVKSFEKRTWTEPNSGKERVQYSPIHIDLLEESWKTFDE